MARSYFQFKQFLVQQDLCAMKVCTDACLLGAIAAMNSPVATSNVLDIGTGTGLLSLMVAQTLTTAVIDAVELEPNALLQAQQNFIGSPFAVRLKTHHTTIQDFGGAPLDGYEVIVCNPPFYTSHLKSPKVESNFAKHNDMLPPDALAASVGRLLHPFGVFWMLIPYSESAAYLNEMQNKNLYLQSQYNISDTEHSPIIRQVLCFGRDKNLNSFNNKMFIKNMDNTYSDTFIGLLKNYYLHL